MMKLAEALMLRSDLQKKIAWTRKRIQKDVVVKKNCEPAIDAGKLIEKTFYIITELESLVIKINSANLSYKLPDGRTLTEAIAHRDALIQKHSIVQKALEESQDSIRYLLSEDIHVITLDISSYEDQAEDLARNIRELNGLIQQTNWKYELE